MILASLLFAAYQSAPSPTVNPSGLITAVSVITIIGIVVNAAVHLRSSGRIEGAILERLKGHDEDIADLKNSRSSMWDKIRETEREVYVMKNTKGRTIHG